jgi:Kef-type K+ transport system membrane component KefB
MIPELSFSGLFIVAVVAFSVPLVLGLAPRLRLPSVVLEIVAGIIIGPSVLGWVEVDPPIQVFALVGVAFALFLAGLEIEFEQLRGRLLKVTGLGFGVSFGLALSVSYGLMAAGLMETPLFLAIVLSATALSVLIPLLKDAGETSTEFGQLVLVGASIADFATLILLSLFFSQEAAGIGTQVVLIGGIVLLAAVVIVSILAVERSMWLSGVLLRLQDTSAQIRVRGAFLILAVFVALAERLGFEVILGAFIAGAIVKLVDRDERMTHPEFRHRLEAIGYGVFIPFFFVTSGLRFNLEALFASPSAIVSVPVLLAALLVVRGVPALLYRPLIGGRRTVAAGLFQATSLGFIVVAAQIGMELGTISEALGAALVAAGLLSVLIFPAAGLTILRRGEPASTAALPLTTGGEHGTIS